MLNYIVIYDIYDIFYDIDIEININPDFDPFDANRPLIVASKSI